jgi:hypothetical protein
LVTAKESQKKIKQQADAFEIVGKRPLLGCSNPGSVDFVLGLKRSPGPGHVGNGQVGMMKA